MSDVLPSTWLRLELGKVVAYGSTEKAEPESISPDTWVLELEDIEKDTSRIIQKLTFAERQSKSTKNRFENGDVLYGKLRPYLNKVVQADRAGVCTTEIIPIKANAAVNGRFLFHWFRHPAFLTYVTEVSHGVNMPRLGTEAGQAAPFVLPPLPEQKRIADKLDSVLARVDACRNRLDRLPALLKRFRQSILAAATSGQLTEDWRDSAPCQWNSVRLGSVAKFIDYRGKTPTKTASGTPLITAKNVRRGFVSFEPREFIAESGYEAWMTRGFPTKGDVLITTEAPLGNVAVIDWDFKFALAQRIICLQFNDQIIGTYAAIALQSDLFQAQLSNQSTGSTVAGIKASRLKELQVEIPPIPEQTEIVRRVEILFAFADRLEARLATARLQVGQLTPALLAKAFRGELVAQDPADEPAAELLKRLAAQREAAPKAKRGHSKT